MFFWLERMTKKGAYSMVAHLISPGKIANSAEFVQADLHKQICAGILQNVTLGL